MSLIPAQEDFDELAETSSVDGVQQTQQQRQDQGPQASEDNAVAAVSIAGIHNPVAEEEPVASPAEAEAPVDSPLDILTPRAICLEEGDGGGACTRPYRRTPSTVFSMADFHHSAIHHTSSLPIVKS